MTHTAAQLLRFPCSPCFGILRIPILFVLFTTIENTSSKMQLSVLLTLFTVGLAAADTTSEGRYIVKLKGDVNVPLFLEKFGREIESNRHEFDLLSQYEHVFKGFAAKLSNRALKMLRQSDMVEYIERDAIFSVSQVPWGLDRIDQLSPSLDGSYNPIGTGAGVDVYVLDTGILVSHEDFDGRAINAYDATDGDGIDCNGHGTHCAAVIGGTTWGVAKDVTLNSVRVFGCSGSGSAVDIIEACEWVLDNGTPPNVVSLSFSGSGLTSLDEAVDQLITAGFIVVASAGNDLSDACNYSPGRTLDSITVAATDDEDTRAYFSNFGSCVDMFAPGVNIESAWIGSDSDSRTLSGNSAAVPHVAGAAAILLETGGSMTPVEVKTSLVDRAIIGAVQNPGAGTPNRLLYVGTGDGPNTPPTVPDCSFTITTNESVITSPNYPSPYDNNELCDWTITTDEGFYVQLVFDDFDLEGHENCDYDSVNIYDDATSNSYSKIATLCGSVNPGVFNSTGSDMYLTFISDADGIARGFSATVTFLEIIAPTFPPATGSCSCDDTCDLDLNYINSPNYPAEYEDDTDCSYQFSVPMGFFINVTFLDFNLENSGTCSFDKLVIYDGVDDSAEEIAELCGAILPDPVFTSGPDVYIEFTTDSSVVRTGFLAAITATDQLITRPPQTATPGTPPSFTSPPDECGTVFTSPGEMTSPNWPANYDPNTDCGQTIQAPVGSRIELTFTDFELEGPSSCPYDRVTVYEGSSPTDPVIGGPFCSTTIPLPVTSSGNVMHVYFESDGSIQYPGFRATFVFLQS